MTTAMMSSKLTTNLTQLVRSVLDLLGFGYGTAKFEVNAAGELVHTANVVTIKLKPKEDPAAFITRLRTDYDWKPGDVLEITSDGGQLNYARITRVPR